MNKRKMLLIIIVSLLLTVGIGIRIWYVNTTAPAIEREVYSMNQWVDLDGCFFENIKENTGGYAVRVTGAHYISFDDYIEKYELSKSMFPEGQKEPTEIIEVTLEYRNVGNDKGYISLLGYSMKADRDSIDYRVDNWLIRAVVPQIDDFMNVRIRPDSEYAISLPFAISAGYTESGKTPKYLTVSNAPIEKVIEIHVMN